MFVADSCSEEGRAIRMKRLKKFKSNRMFFTLGIQLLVLIYMFASVTTYMTGATNAAFHDIEKLQASLHVQWDVDISNCTQQFGEWDCSSLEWVDEDEGKHGFDPDRNVIFSHIQYSDSDKDRDIHEGPNPMTGPWGFEVYYSPSGGVVNNGEKIYENGIIDIFDVGTIQEITFEPTEGAGNYKFKFIRPEGHPGADSGGWSPTMKVYEINKNMIIEDEEDQSSENKKEETNEVAKEEENKEIEKEVEKEKDEKLKEDEKEKKEIKEKDDSKESENEKKEEDAVKKEDEAKEEDKEATNKNEEQNEKQEEDDNEEVDEDEEQDKADKE